MELRGKTVVLTGASRGLGVDMATGYARAGANLVLAARSAGELEKTKAKVEEAGAQAVAVPTDVGDFASLEALVRSSKDAFGSIDVLVNNAGVEKVYDFEHMELQEITLIIDVNITGLITLTRLVVPEMIERRSGQVVNISSMAGLLPVPHNTVYSASKHAVVGFSHSLRLELADHNVGVSVVCPGFVDAGMFAEWGRKAPAAAGSVSPEDVAKATLKATVGNLPEVRVIPPLGRSGPVWNAISSRMYAGMVNRMGVTKFLRDQAALNKEKS